MSNIVPSVLTLALDEIENHVAYIGQQNLRNLVDFNDRATYESGYGVAVRHLVDELGQRLGNVEHHLSWARATARNLSERDIDLDDAFPDFTEPNLVQARIALAQALTLADLIRNLTYGSK